MSALRRPQGREAFQEVDYRQTFRDLAKWVEEIDDPARIPEGLTASVLIVDDQVRGVIVFEDRIRDEAAAVIAALRTDGRRISLLTGDRRGVAESVAASVGIDSKNPIRIRRQK